MQHTHRIGRNKRPGRLENCKVGVLIKIDKNVRNASMYYINIEKSARFNPDFIAIEAKLC